MANTQVTTVINWKPLEEIMLADGGKYWVIVDGTEVIVNYYESDDCFGDVDGHYNFEPDDIEYIDDYQPPKHIHTGKPGTSGGGVACPHLSQMNNNGKQYSLTRTVKN